MKEGIMINKSLSALGNVISALTDAKATHIPCVSENHAVVHANQSEWSFMHVFMVCIHIGNFWKYV